MGSSKKGGGGADKAAKYQAQAQREAMDQYQKMWEQTNQWLSPYREAGIPALQSLQYLSSPGGESDFLQSYYNSQQFKDMSQAARGQQLAAAEATGGLGSTSTGNALAAIAPQLGQAALSDQRGMMGSLANMGQSAAAGQAASGMNYGGNMAQMLQGMGAIRAGGVNQQSGLGSAISGGVGGALGGAGLSTALGMSGPWGAAIGGGLGILGSLF